MTDSQFSTNQEKSFAKIRVLDNPTQEYEWGSKTEIQNLLGLSKTSNKPIAELWMGAHPKAPSKVMVEGEWKSLKEVIEKDPESVLGKEIAQRFSNTLPFLFKVLAAAKPLSVQAHPNMEQAREGFARENRLGISFEAPKRNYKDENHKPEIICALTSFHSLLGFRNVEDILELMEKACPAALSKELASLKTRPDPHGLRCFLETLMAMNRDKQGQVVKEAIDRAESRFSKDRTFHWVIKLNRFYPGDIGILSPLYLHPVQLNPGEAVYLPAGELHAYLDGVGIELMANSDNVLRGGLTSKHIDIHELLNIVNFKPESVKKIQPIKKGICEEVYPTPAEEFLLSVVSVHQGVSFISSTYRSVEILICIEGAAHIIDLETGEVLPLSKGTAILVPAVVVRYRITGEAVFYKASVPL